MKRWKLGDLAAELNAELRGDSDAVVERLDTLSSAVSGSLSFLANRRYKPQLSLTRATAVIVAPSLAEQCAANLLISPDPYLCYARASQLFSTRYSEPPVIHPGAIIAASASLGKSVSIGANAVIAENVQLADHVIIGAGTVVGAGSSIGEGSRLHAQVTLYDDVHIGRRCVIHSGAIIGADGFGFAPDGERWQPIAQLGGVRINDDVNIGANTTIDRGALDDTLIGEGVILDNQIQIGHNCEIGDYTAIAGCTGIAGSTKIGRHCTIAGDVGIAGHLTICDHVHLTMRCTVTQSIAEPGSYSSGTVQQPSSRWRRNQARFQQLDQLAKRVAQLEQLLGKQQETPIAKK